MRGTSKIVMALIVLSAAVATSALAANPKSGSSINLVVLSSTARTADGGASFGDKVTFDVSTATSRPYVLLSCYQGSTLVLTGQAGFWASYPSKSFTLSSMAWTGGAADCTARLGSLNADGTRFTQLAATSFSVAA